MSQKTSAVVLALVVGIGVWGHAAGASAQVVPKQDQARRPAAARAPTPTADQQPCDQTKRILDARESQLIQLEGQRAGHEAEIRLAEERLAELRQQKNSIDADIAALQQWLNERRQRWEDDCGTSRTCEKYEMEADRLQAQLAPAQEELEAIGQGVNAVLAKISELEKAIYPLVDEYNRMGCSNLAPGMTTQTAIERCAALLSTWNKLQADLNALNNTLPNLQVRYVQLQRQVDAFQQVLDEYTAYLVANCGQSAKLQAARRMAARTVRSRNAASSISDAVQRLKKLRSVRLERRPR